MMKLCLLLVATLLCAGVSSGQDLASLSGTVSDEGGCVVKVGKVSLYDHQGRSVGTAALDESGRYSFKTLAPGLYDVEVQAPGFASQHLVAISVVSSQHRLLPRTILVLSGTCAPRCLHVEKAEP